MGGNSNSLAKYRDGVICSNTNKGWPQINQSVDYSGSSNRMYSTNVGTILNGKNTPTINWGSATVPDRILYSNGLWNSSSSSSSSSSASDKLAKAATVFAGLTAVASFAVPLISLFASNKSNVQNSGFSKSERKEISRNTTDSQDSMTALNSCVNTANSVDENTSAETLADINSNLMDSISTAEAQKSDALRNVETAKATKNTKTQALQSERAVMDGLLNEKANLTTQIGDLKKQLENSEVSDEQKKLIKEQINKFEKQLKDTENKIDASQKKIDNLEAEIAVQDEIISQNTQTANALEARIKAARTAAARVDNMIKSKEGN